MKISIDTREDSHEEIKHAIRILSSIVDQLALTNSPESGSEEEEESTGDANPNMFAMFGASAPSASETASQSSDAESSDDEDYIEPVKAQQVETQRDETSVDVDLGIDQLDTYDN